MQTKIIHRLMELMLVEKENFVYLINLLFQYYQEYLKQQEEIRALQKVLLSKNNRIRLLEEELCSLKSQSHYHTKL